MEPLDRELGLTGNYMNMANLVKLHVLNGFPSAEKPAYSVSMEK